MHGIPKSIYCSIEQNTVPHSINTTVVAIMVTITGGPGFETLTLKSQFLCTILFTMYIYPLETDLFTCHAEVM
jgi:hypothetical protein